MSLFSSTPGTPCCWDCCIWSGAGALPMLGDGVGGGALEVCVPLPLPADPPEEGAEDGIDGLAIGAPELPPPASCPIIMALTGRAICMTVALIGTCCPPFNCALSNVT